MNGVADAIVQLGAILRRIAGRGARDDTTAGREHRVRLVGDRFDDEIAANAVRLADPPDDDQLTTSDRVTAAFDTLELAPGARELARSLLGADRHGGRVQLAAEARFVARS